MRDSFRRKDCIHCNDTPPLGQPRRTSPKRHLLETKRDHQAVHTQRTAGPSIPLAVRKQRPRIYTLVLYRENTSTVLSQSLTA